MDDKKVDNETSMVGSNKAPTKNKQNSRNMWIGLSAILAAVILTVVVVVAVVLNLPHSTTCKDESDDDFKKCLLNESVTAYKSGGTNAVLDMYDNYIKLAETKEEKQAYMINKVEGLNEACDYSCSDEILETINELMETEETDDSVATICAFGVFYSIDQKYMDYCDRREVVYE